MLFLYFKLNKKFSDANVIREIRQDAQKLVADIAFQTDKSVTVIEDKIRQANFTASELEKRIVLAKTEQEKKTHEVDVLNSLAEKEKAQVPKVQPTKIEIPTKKPEPVKEKTESSSEKNGEAVKIYTKQILLNSKNKAIMPKESFHDQIVEMARKGFSAELIAEKVPMPLGEIELIISMNA